MHTNLLTSYNYIRQWTNLYQFNASRSWSELYLNPLRIYRPIDDIIYIFTFLKNGWFVLFISYRYKRCLCAGNLFEYIFIKKTCNFRDAVFTPTSIQHSLTFSNANFTHSLSRGNGEASRIEKCIIKAHNRFQYLRWL